MEGVEVNKFNFNFRNNIIFDILGGLIFGGGPGGGVILPHFFGLNLLVRVNLRYTPNYSFLGFLEVSEKFVWWWVGRWVGGVNQL